MSGVQVDVYELARLGQTRCGEVSSGDLLRLQALCVAPNALDPGWTQPPVQYEWLGWIDAQGRPAADVRLKTHVPLSCTHCDQTVAVDLDVRRRYYFVPDEQTLQSIEVDIQDVEPLVGSKHFDLHTLIEDELILALPIAARHEACQQRIDNSEPLVQPEEPMPSSAFAVLASLKAGLRK